MARRESTTSTFPKFQKPLSETGSKDNSTETIEKEVNGIGCVRDPLCKQDGEKNDMDHELIVTVFGFGHQRRWHCHVRGTIR